MTTTQAGQQPMWSDEDIANDAKRASSNPTEQAKIRSCLLFMRAGYEAKLDEYEAVFDHYVTQGLEGEKREVALLQRVAELEQQLADLRKSGCYPSPDMSGGSLTIGGPIIAEWRTTEEDEAWAHLQGDDDNE